MNKTHKSSVKILTPTVHALFDYLLVILLFILPSVISGVSTRLAIVLYTLGGLHLINSLSTDFDGGLFAAITLRAHALIEILAAVALVISPWVIGFSGVARNTVIAVGVFVFIVWMLTDFNYKGFQEGSDTQKESANENKNMGSSDESRTDNTEQHE